MKKEMLDNRVVFSLGLVLLLAGLVTVDTACAQQKGEKEAEAATQTAQAPVINPRQQALISQVRGNLNALNLQQVTVQVLAGQYQKELANLQQSQAVFCDTYNLDVGKFRQGVYRFNEREAKFVEVELTPPAVQ